MAQNSFVLVIGHLVGISRQECGYELRETGIKLLSLCEPPEPIVELFMIGCRLLNVIIKI